jgi:beta-N-acetylhexosaminidase
VAEAISQKSITLVKDDRQAVPLPTPRQGSILYLSVLDYPSNWRIASPSRTFLPELRKRWADVTAVELSDRSTPNELELVRAMAPRFDAVLASVFARTSSGSGRIDLAPGIVRLMQDLARTTAARDRPFVTTVFGNPYVVMGIPDLPAVLLTYDFYDLAERSALKAIAGEAPIGGRLPIALPGMFPVGHGLDRTSTAPSAP